MRGDLGDGGGYNFQSSLRVFLSEISSCRFGLHEDEQEDRDSRHSLLICVWSVDSAFGTLAWDIHV